MTRNTEISPTRKARLIDLLKLERERGHTTFRAMSESYHLSEGALAKIVRGTQRVPLRLAEAILEQMGISDIETALGPEEAAEPEPSPARTPFLGGEERTIGVTAILAMLEPVARELARIVLLLRARADTDNDYPC